MCFQPFKEHNFHYFIAGACPRTPVAAWMLTRSSPASSLATRSTVHALSKVLWCWKLTLQSVRHSFGCSRYSFASELSELKKERGTTFCELKKFLEKREFPESEPISAGLPVLLHMIRNADTTEVSPMQPYECMMRRGNERFPVCLKPAANKRPYPANYWIRLCLKGLQASRLLLRRRSGSTKHYRRLCPWKWRLA